MAFGVPSDMSSEAHGQNRQCMHNVMLHGLCKTCALVSLLQVCIHVNHSDSISLAVCICLWQTILFTCW